MPLGYNDSAGLFASSFSVPNNLPAILIRGSARWTPFFNRRSVTASLAEEFGTQRPLPDASQHVEDAGQIRLAVRLRDQRIAVRWHAHLAMLALLPATDDELSLKIGLDVENVSQIRDALTRLNLADDTGRLTATGRQTLERFRRKPRRSSAELHPDPSPYYPRFKR